MQTLWWRAPEVAFGDAGFGSAADMWSCGLALAEMAGCLFHHSHKTQKLYVKALVQQFGTPAATSLAGLPLYQSGLPASTRKPWPADVFAVVGSPGIELLDGLLAWEPSHRVSASAALDRPFFGNGHFSLVGSAGNTGKRHDWNLLAADMPHDALMWLRADPSLTGEGLAALKLNFGMSDKRTKSEAGRKIILAGYSNVAPATKQMCNLSLGCPLPIERFAAWASAFHEVNADSLAVLESHAK